MNAILNKDNAINKFTYHFINNGIRNSRIALKSILKIYFIIYLARILVQGVLTCHRDETNIDKEIGFAGSF